MTNAKKADASRNYLLQVANIKQQIVLINERLEELRARAENISAITYGPESFRKSDKGTSRTERLVTRIDDCIQQLVTRHSALLDTEIRLTEQINKMPFEKERYVLEWKYIQCKSLEETSIILGYSYRHTNRIHGEALLDFYSLFLDDTCTMLDSPF